MKSDYQALEEILNEAKELIDELRGLREFIRIADKLRKEDSLTIARVNQLVDVRVLKNPTGPNIRALISEAASLCNYLNNLNIDPKSKKEMINYLERYIGKLERAGEYVRKGYNNGYDKILREFKF